MQREQSSTTDRTAGRQPSLLKRLSVFDYPRYRHPARLRRTRCRSGIGDARDCWNPDLYSPGTTTATRVLADDSGNYFDFTTAITVGLLNGINVLSTIGTSEYYQDNELTQETSSVRYGTQPAPFRTRNFRGEFRSLANGEESLSVSTFEPYVEGRFDLLAGESYVEEYTLVTRTEANGVVNEFETEVSQLITFEGIKTISLPPGTFLACRFRSEPTTTAGFPGYYWIGVGNGLVLDQDPEAGEVVFGSINGADI